MGLFSFLKGSIKRKKGKPAKGQSPDAGAGENLPVTVYPLYDPRRIVPDGPEPPYLSQGASRGASGKEQSFSRQLTNIPWEIGSKEQVYVPHSDSEDSQQQQQLAEVDGEEFLDLPLDALPGDFSPLSASSMEMSLASSGILKEQQQQQEVRRRDVPVERRESRPLLEEPPLAAPSAASSAAEPPATFAAAAPAASPSPVAPDADAPASVPPAAAESPLSLPRPPRRVPSSSSPSASSSRPTPKPSSSSRSSHSSKSRSPSASEKAYRDTVDIESLPTAPTTPRALQQLQRSKQPRLLLLQPYVIPHPATVRMQREGRRICLRCKQLQMAIDLYAASGGLQAFRVKPHDATNCDPCRFGDFSDAPLLW